MSALFFNPFRPHLVIFPDHSFGVRRFGWRGWEFYCRLNKGWVLAEDTTHPGYTAYAETDARDVLDGLSASRGRRHAKPNLGRYVR